MDAIKQLILNSVVNHPNDLITYVSKEAGLSRPAIHKHVRTLLEQGLIRNSSTKKTRPHYLLGNEENRSEQNVISPEEGLTFEKKYVIPIKKHVSEDEVWKKYLVDDLKSLKQNVFQICQYGFTEMFNNVIDHSGAKQARVILKRGTEIELIISDNGVGIFEKIKKFHNLSGSREAILHLSKGKLTTDPVNHSGQGIFFTSRAFDQFSISSNNLSFIRLAEADWFLEENPDTKKGTLVKLKISTRSNLRLEDLFRRYTSGDEMDFNKTHALVELSKYKDENFISRSQAKRLLLNLEKFLVITFDFKGVRSVGQGFVDEIFRVFQNYHPNIELNYKNANENIEFMIKRGVHSS